MKLLLQSLVIACIFSVPALYPAPLRAQDPEPPVYTPTSAWLVGPANLGDTGVFHGKTPCVVANQFGNGFVLRFSGGGGELVAMAIDFRQKAFEKRRKYEIEFSIPGVFFQSLVGAAFDEETLLFSLADYPDFHTALQDAETLVITVKGAAVALNLVGLKDGFARMDACYGPAAPKEKKSILVQKDEEISSEGDSVQNPLIKPNRDEGAAMAEPDSVDPQAEEAARLLDKAREAEDLARQLASTAEGPAQAQMPLPSPAVKAAPQPARQAQRPRTDIIAGAKAPVSGTGARMRWRALKGADLQDVLSLWSEGAGVRLMWLSDISFPVQRSLSFDGTFETALQMLLEQYSAQSMRPIGRIYREPGSQKMILVVERDIHAGK